MAPWGGDTFQPIQSPKFVTPKTNNHREQVEDLLDYPFLPRRFSSPELCHFFTLYTNIGVKVRLLFPLSLKCALNEHGAVLGAHWTIEYSQYFDEFP